MCVILPVSSYSLPLPSFSAQSAPVFACKFPLLLCSTHLLFNLIEGPPCSRLYSCYSVPELFFFQKHFPISPLHKVHSAQQLCLFSSCASSQCPFFYLISLKQAASPSSLSLLIITLCCIIIVGTFFPSNQLQYIIFFFFVHEFHALVWCIRRHWLFAGV